MIPKLLIREWITTTTINKREESSLSVLVRAQLKIGATGFGGPLAAISFMKKEFVEDRQLLSSQRFLEGLAFVKLLPGPVSTLLSIFIGREVAGFWGGLVSGLAYIFPSFLMLLLISNFESILQNTRLAEMGFSFSPLLATILGIIVYTCYKLFIDSLELAKKDGPRGYVFSCFVFGLAALLSFYRVQEFLLLVSCGFTGIAWHRFQSRKSEFRVALGPLFWVFFVSSFSVFGTGYMILPALHKVLVEQRHWLGDADFLRAMTYGNLTPGPIVISSTYFGFKIAGNPGALVATLGIFLPPFVLMLGFGPYLSRVLSKPWSRGFVEGIIPAVSASILVSLVFLSLNLHWGWVEGLAFVLGLFLSLKKVPALKIMGLGALLILLEKT